MKTLRKKRDTAKSESCFEPKLILLNNFIVRVVIEIKQGG